MPEKGYRKEKHSTYLRRRKRSRTSLSCSPTDFPSLVKREWRKRIDDEPGPVVNPVATRGEPPTSLSRPPPFFWSLPFCLYKPKKDSSFLGLVMGRRGEEVTGRCVSGRMMAIDG